MENKQKTERKTEKQYVYSRLHPRPLRTGYNEMSPSIVVPDRNMEMSVIMKKYAGGQHRGLQPNYVDPEMMDMVQGIDARKLSICELHQRIDENKQRIRALQNNIQLQEQRKRVKEAEIAHQKYREQIASELKKELEGGAQKH